MGTVYEAEDITLERRVSLKVMKPEIAKNPQHRERFLREACTAASVESVFICPIYEVGEDNGIPFIAMPFLQGEPLNAHWKKNPRLALDEVLRIGKEVAEGLSAAHEAGLVHRDIKPANIWLETQPSGPPRAIILDFGLARVQADNVQITQSGVIVGTPAYMSPEQARGNKDLDPRTDLFSLGCVLYAVCTGELPFKGKQMMDVLLALATQDPTPPHAIAATVPQPLSELILRLLAKNPDDRPRTARVVIDELLVIQKDFLKPAQGAVTTRIKPAAKTGRTTRPIAQKADQTEVLSASATSGAVRGPAARQRSYALYTLVGIGLLGCVISLVGGGVYYFGKDEGTIENPKLAGPAKAAEPAKPAEPVKPAAANGDRAFSDADVKRIAALPAARQVEEVRNELVKRNPGFAGNFTPEIADNAVKGLKFTSDRVVDISPVRALTRLQSLDMQGTGNNQGSLADLTPLKGMPLTALVLDFNPVQDLSPLKGMSLKTLNLMHTRVTDLTPLKGMPLETLMLWGWPGTDLTPLKGLPLRWLNCGGGNKQIDLRPLAGSKLEFLCINLTRVNDLTPLKDVPLKQLLCSNSRVWDLTPLRGMRLEEVYLLNCPLGDVTPLAGMPVHTLDVKGTWVSNLLPLRDMPLKTLSGEFQAKRDARLLLPIKTLATINEMPAERFFNEVVFAPRLAPMLRGDDEPADDVERLAFAKYASAQKKYRLAVRLWADALANDPKLADDRAAQHRYHAARAALLGAAGKGEDQPPLYNATRAKLRRQALDWLKAELTVWTGRFDGRAERAEYVWIDDDIPPGAMSWEPWTWVTRPQHPVLSGSRAVMLEADGIKQHVFTDAPTGLRVGTGGSLFANVYLDPARPPKQIMLQWNTGGWMHRAYWGGNLVDFGRDGTTERVRMGPLPEAGKWVRLEVEAARVGIDPAMVIRGWAFTQHGGTAYWDRAGNVTQGGPGSPQDVLAALSAWQQDADLAGVRDAAALAKLPGDERNEWQALWARVPDVRPVVPTSKEEGQKWRYTTAPPAEGWQKADFDDKQWQQGVGGFGTDKDPARGVRTEWKTDDIWLRREFTLPDGKWDGLVLLVNHDDDAEVYINGVLAHKVKDWSNGEYVALPLSGAARAAMQPGKNVFAIHCHNVVGPQYIDVGIVAVQDNPGRLLYAQIAYDRKQFALAAAPWARALAGEPKLGDDRQVQHRYHTARAALLAAAGQGQDAPQDDAAKATLRGQALEWLNAELTAYEKQPRLAPVQTLWHWQQHSDFAGIREPAALANLPPKEQKRCAQFWAERREDGAAGHRRRAPGVGPDRLRPTDGCRRAAGYVLYGEIAGLSRARSARADQRDRQQTAPAHPLRLDRAVLQVERRDGPGDPCGLERGAQFADRR